MKRSTPLPYASSSDETLVIALGGNALRKKGEDFSIDTQYANVLRSMQNLLPLFTKGRKIAITHGNGPQVGVEFHRNILAREWYPPYPLDVLNANTQGWIGYLIVNALHQVFQEHGISRAAVGVITRVEVDPKDPAFQNPTKPIGDFYTEEEAQRLQEVLGLPMREDAGRGWRAVVPSPWPQHVVEAPVIRNLVSQGVVTVAVGGGGIPVVRQNHGYQGIPAVIDKDRASAVLALEIGARRLIILTEVDQVYLNFGTPQAQPLDHLTAAQAAAYLAEGQFPPGNMGPKIEAALHFLRGGGQEVIITSIERATEALAGTAGTHIHP